MKGLEEEFEDKEEDLRVMKEITVNISTIIFSIYKISKIFKHLFDFSDKLKDKLKEEING